MSPNTDLTGITQDGRYGLTRLLGEGSVGQPQGRGVVLRALAKQPDDRFASMKELEQQLLAIPAQPGAPVGLPIAHGYPLP